MLLDFPLFCVFVYELCPVGLSPPWACRCPMKQLWLSLLTYSGVHWLLSLIWVEGFGLLQWLHSLMVPISPVNFIPSSTLSKMPAKSFKRPFATLPPPWEGHGQASIPIKGRDSHLLGSDLIQAALDQFPHHGLSCDLNTFPSWELRPQMLTVCHVPSATSYPWLTSSSLALGESPFNHGSVPVLIFYMVFHLWSKR